MSAPNEPVPLRVTHLLYGGDYNPEQWPEEVLAEDAALMRRANWNVATLPVFGWVHINPAEGVYTFDWLDRATERLANAGIDLCLATGTASTPAWVDAKYPDVLTVDEQGRQRPHGNRHAFCPSSPSYRRLSASLVRQLALRYGKHPRLKLWHVNNEYGGNWPNYCYCERCIAGFRVYLQERYGTLDRLNAAWSTAFWGHTYTSYDEVDPPFSHGEGSIQAMKIDWRRFQSQNYAACFENEARIVREISPEVPVTTNLMGAFFPLDYRVLAKSLDVVSWDNYPLPDTPPSHVAFSHALMRGLRAGQPFLLMEQTPSQQNWAPYCRLKPPRQLRLQSFQAVAHGAESVMFFQWRRSRGGIEKFHGAVVEHHGRADARVFREVSALGAELQGLGSRTLHGRTPARVAVLFDWECWWALAASSGPSRDLDYHREVVTAYAALHEAGIQTDVVGPSDDLARYDVIVAPTAYLIREEQARSIADRVRDGTTLVATFFTGVVDDNDRVHPGGAPGPLREVLGVSVEEFDALPSLPSLPSPAQGVRFAPRMLGATNREEHVASILAERLWLEGATALAWYTADFYAGDPALTVNNFGKGKAYYVATHLADEALTAFLRAVCLERGIASPLRDGKAPPAGVEVVLRAAPAGSGALLYLLNHASEPREVELGSGTFTDLLTGRDASGSVSLASRDVVVLDIPYTSPG
jgi:beta-galactosidase